MEGESGAPGGGGGQRRRVRPRAAVAVMRGGGWIRGGTRRTKPGAAGPLLPQRDRDNQRDAGQRRVELTERMRPLRPQGSLPSTERFQLLCAKQAQRGTHQLCSCREWRLDCGPPRCRPTAGRGRADGRPWCWSCTAGLESGGQAVAEEGIGPTSSHRPIVNRHSPSSRLDHWDVEEGARARLMNRISPCAQCRATLRIYYSKYMNICICNWIVLCLVRRRALQVWPPKCEPGTTCDGPGGVGLWLGGGRRRGAVYGRGVRHGDAQGRVREKGKGGGRREGG